jgi:hypothetical protein
MASTSSIVTKGFALQKCARSISSASTDVEWLDGLARMSEDGVDIDSLDESDVFGDDDIEAPRMRTRTWDWFEDDDTDVAVGCPSLQLGCSLCPFPMFEDDDTDVAVGCPSLQLGCPLCPFPMFTMPPVLVDVTRNFTVAQWDVQLTSIEPHGLEFSQNEDEGVSPIHRATRAAQHHAEAQAAADQKTTVMLRNIPNNYNRDSFVELLDSQGFSGLYDFIYVPLDFKSRVAIGYAFLNFTSHVAALRAFDVFHGFSTWRGKSRKVCEVTWSETHQGLEANIEVVQSSKMNRRRVPEVCKPFIIKNGQRMMLPPPSTA